MNRNLEFDKLKYTLDEDIIFLPKENYNGVIKKFKNYKTRKRLFNSVVSSFCAFALVVNIFPSVAYAMQDIPFIGDLTKVVSFSTSLSKAVELDYIDYIGLTKSKDGVTVTIEHMIADQKRVNLFFTVVDINGQAIDIPSPQISWDGMLDNDSTSGLLSHDQDVVFDMLTNDVYTGKHTYMFTKDFVNTTPSNFDITIDTLVGQFIFTIDVDAHYIQQGTQYQVDNKNITVEGQKFDITNVAKYPTHIEITIVEDENNTAYINQLFFYLENENGQKLTHSTNGYVFTQDFDKPNEKIYHMESDYFYDSKNLTLNLQGVHLLDKDLENIKFDLSNKSAEWLPQGMRFESFTNETKDDMNYYALTFSEPPINHNRIVSNPNWSGFYKTPNGDTHVFDSSIGSQYDENSRFFWTYYIQENKYNDIIYLMPTHTRSYLFDDNSISIPLDFVD